MIITTKKKNNKSKKQLFIFLFFIMVACIINLSIQVASLTEDLIMTEDTLSKALMKNVNDNLKCDIEDNKREPEIIPKAPFKEKPNII